MCRKSIPYIASEDDVKGGFFNPCQPPSRPHKSRIIRELIGPPCAKNQGNLSTVSESTDPGIVDATCAVQHPPPYLRDRKWAIARVACSLFVLYLQLPAGYWNAVVIETALGKPKDGAFPESVDGGGTGNTSTTSNGASTLPSSGSSKNHGNSKRQRGKRSDGDRPGRRGSKRTPVPNAPGHGDTSGPHWACPFYLHNRQENWRCLGFRLKRIGDVRQHIRRKHVVPIHCPICGAEFANENLRIEHINASYCQQHLFNLPGATVDQIVAMKRAADDGNASTDVERWFEIWRILFPGIPEPESPYVPSGLSAGTCLISLYRHSTRFQQQVISLAPGDGSAQTENIMAAVLDDLSLFFTERQTNRIQSGNNETANAENPPSLIMSPPLSANLHTFSQNPPQSISHLPLEPSTDAFNSPQTQGQDYIPYILQYPYQATQFLPNENADAGFDFSQDLSDSNWSYNGPSNGMR
ncbi:hypothetical protein M434DRAFT_387044 [Hypoxylon sp. CO27-5]|nr:hypothetical protein M434DRAFT_387044 [Hypoxylon sp. CO27-5]